MVAHSGGSHGDEMVSRMPNGSSSSSSASGATGGSGGVAKQALKKGPWTAAEDAILIEYVKKNGEGNWNAVQKNTSLARCGKSCRLRWTNHLRPNLKKGSFTLEEERLILQLHAQLGNKWARMAAQLPGRTDNEIKNYWNTRIKRRIRQGLPLYPNDLTPQKQPTSSALQPQTQPVAAAAIRGRPPLQIPARTISQVLAQSHSPSPTLSPIPLSPQCNYSFTHSSSLFDPTTPLSPSTNSLLSPHSPTILSPSHILNSYHNPSDSFPGFLSAPQTSPLTLPTAIPFQFSPLNFNIYSPQGLQTTQSPGTVYTLLNPAELPSNQLFLSPVQKPVSKPEPEHRTNSKVSIPKSSSIELLEDLLEQAEVLSSNENLQRHSDLFNLQDAWDISVGSDNSSPEIGPGIKNEVKEENEYVNVKLSKLLQSIPSPANIPEEFNCLVDNLSMPSLDLGSGVVVTEDSLGLNMEQITSIFQADPASTDISRQAASCTWDNLPRMC